MINKIHILKKILNHLDIKISLGTSSKLYTFCRTKDLKSIMKIGLCSTKTIANNDKILHSIFPSKEEVSNFKKNYNPKDISQKGISVFFNKYTREEILSLDPEHPLSEEDFTLLEINYEQLKKDYPNLKIMGMELVPYDDEQYEAMKNKIEKILSDEDIDELSTLSFDDAWANYFSGEGFFAPNVPHGILLIDIILPKYIR